MMPEVPENDDSRRRLNQQMTDGIDESAEAERSRRMIVEGLSECLEMLTVENLPDFEYAEG